MAVKEHGAGVQKPNHRQRLFTQDGQVERAAWRLKNDPTGTRYRINGITNHLRTDFGKSLSQGLVSHVVKRDSIPDSGFAHSRYQRVTNFGKGNLERMEALGLLRRYI